MICTKPNQENVYSGIASNQSTTTINRRKKFLVNWIAMHVTHHDDDDDDLKIDQILLFFSQNEFSPRKKIPFIFFLGWLV